VSPRSDNPVDRIPGPLRPSLPLWLGLLVPPSAALAHITFGYPLEHTACATGSVLSLHLLTLGLLVIDLLAGWIAHGQWVKLGSTIPQDSPAPFGSRRLMALSGMVSAAAFALFIVAQWFPLTMLPPCIRT